MQCSWDTAEEIVTIFLQGWFVLRTLYMYLHSLLTQCFIAFTPFPCFSYLPMSTKLVSTLLVRLSDFVSSWTEKVFFFIQRSIVLSWEKFYLLISQHFWPQYRTCKSISDSCQLQWSWWCKLQQPFIWIKCLRKISETTPPRRLNACDLQ